MSVHQRIRSGRLALGLTEKEFADRVGVSRGAVQQWEKPGGTAPTRRNQPAVAALLGLSISELMDPGHGMAAKETGDAPTPDLSPAAYELARLFDMLPDDRVVRTMAYNAATSELLKALRGAADAPTSEPNQAVSGKKQRA